MSSSDVTPSTPRARFQFSLRLILLLMGAIGVWTAAIVNWRVNAGLEKRIAAMRPLARELDIKDPNKIAIVKCDEHWYDENQWDVYVPSAGFELKIATRDIDAQGEPVARKSIALPAGRYRLALTQTDHKDGSEVTVTRDGQEILNVDEEKGWYPSGGSTGGGQFSLSEQFAPDKKIVLFRRRFSQPITQQNGFKSNQTPMGPCNGLMLWIEPAAPSAPKPQQ